MRILLLTHAFNSLTQRLAAELRQRGHLVSVEFDISDSVTEEAATLFSPDLIVAPYLRRAIPESVWQRFVCLIVHPGVVGDRGPSALDWAILQQQTAWGVTVLQAQGQMDAGPVWASAPFAMRPASKASLYRHEVSQTATDAVLQAVAHVAACNFAPQRPGSSPWQPLVRQADRAIDWQADSSATVLRKIRSADGFPGVADALFGQPCHVFDAWPESSWRGIPGEVLAQRETALLRATVDGAVWLGHVKRTGSIKLPATL
ncbi:MAG: formyltransferase family protein, partial [Rhodoferax sp.]|nr:formyltransferase family protein [Rhodoferax sp.]